jgi:hypothetical protein
MGIDYVGLKSSFHLTWSRVGFVKSLLTQLGADLPDWNGSKNNWRISTRACRALAKILKDNIDRFRVVKIPDKYYKEGYSRAPLVDGIPLEKELSTEGYTGRMLLLNDGVERAFGERYTVDPRKVKVGPATRRDRKWILDFADFLEECGGCEVLA